MLLFYAACYYNCIAWLLPFIIFYDCSISFVYFVLLFHFGGGPLLVLLALLVSTIRATGTTCTASITSTTVVPL
jgi:hypothetical protein